ncbi:MAG: GGDEF domain-containing protein [Lachnospiraceae bacterium]|nr:GGDEF domain-containing protein [Lachnospiraceae bacterium]
MFYSGFAILALIMHIIINYDFVLRKETRSNGIQNRYYFRYLNTLFVFYIADVMWGFLYELKSVVPVYIDTTMFFLFMALSVFEWTRFVIYYLDNDSFVQKVINIAGWLIIIYTVINLILNLFFPVVFRFYEDGTYEAQDGRFVILSAQILLYFAASIYSFVVSFKKKDKMRVHYRTVAFSTMAMAIFIILQIMDVMVAYYSVGSMICTAILHTFVLEDERKERENQLKESLEREKQQRIELENAKRMITIDSLTGVKNKYSFFEKEKEMEEKIEYNPEIDFGIVVFDVNGLKFVNDTYGHEAGDRWIQNACKLICDIYQHSPVYRIGGDEFVVCLENTDYENREELLREFNIQIEHNNSVGQVVIAAGQATYNSVDDFSVRKVFDRADRRMYIRKKELKESK